MKHSEPTQAQEKVVSLPRKLMKWALWSVLCVALTAIGVQFALHMMSPMSSAVSVIQSWIDDIKFIALTVRVMAYLLVYFLWRYIPLVFSKYRDIAPEDLMSCRKSFFVYLILFELFFLSNILQYL